MKIGGKKKDESLQMQKNESLFLALLHTQTFLDFVVQY